MKKRVITIILSVVACSSIMFGCGGNTVSSQNVAESSKETEEKKELELTSEETEEKKELELTSDMIKGIKQWVDDKESYGGMPVLLCLNAGLHDSSHDYTQWLVTTQEQASSTEYKIYGKVQGTDKFGETNNMKFTCTVTAVETSREDQKDQGDDVSAAVSAAVAEALAEVDPEAASDFDDYFYYDGTFKREDGTIGYYKFIHSFSFS